MLSVIFSLVSSLLMIIPAQGIFLSILFLAASKKKFNPNLTTGFILMIFSIIACFQVLFVQGIPSGDLYLLLSEMLIGPFIFFFLKGSNFIEVRKDHIHLVMMGIILLSYLLTIVFHNVNWVLIGMLMAGGYLVRSAYLLVRALTPGGHSKQPDSVPTQNLIIASLIFLPVLITLLLFLFHSVHLILITQFSKGLIIYYLYYKILASIP
jgi:hypothetical protein